MLSAMKTSNCDNSNSFEIVNLDLDKTQDFSNDEGEDTEFQGLISSSTSSLDEPGKALKQRDHSRDCRGRGRLVKIIGLVFLLIGSGLVYKFIASLFLILAPNSKGSTLHKTYGNKTVSADFQDTEKNISSESAISKTAAGPTISYQCPASIDKAPNDKDGIFDVYNTDTRQHSLALDASLDDLLSLKYGAWGITPNQRKALNAHWIQWYAEALSDSDMSPLSSSRPKTIYESACGVGLTLFVVLQLLQEMYNITGLEVYGNEYMQDDVVTANHFYIGQQISDEAHLHLRKGHICHGDSTNLTFVPSNAFDVVMTGYIDPIVDPLNMHVKKTEHKRYCQQDKDSREGQLMQREQELVEDWFALWTSEMIRIAKPGGTIIVESISQPRCLVGDWGGVAKEWWSGVALTKYGWQSDIDAASIDIIDFDPAQHYKGIHDRYNVKMTKKKENRRM